MKDIPLFTTENGAASLFLREIPYSGVARIQLHATQNPYELLEECIGFCRACGAEEIHGAGHSCLEEYPLVTAIWEMSRDAEGMEAGEGALFPVLPETVEQWREIYNLKMADVPNASHMTEADGRKLLKKGSGYFVHRDRKLLGIGRVSDDTIEVVASVVPGAGAEVVRCLVPLITGDRVRLTVASANERAVRLYERLGFTATQELSRWYKIL